MKHSTNIQPTLNSNRTLYSKIAVGLLLSLTSLSVCAQRIDNSNGRAIDYLTGIWPYNPQIDRSGLANEIGIDEAVSHVSDLATYWNYTSLHYYRLTERGTFGARINSAHRFGTTAVQYQAEAYPVFANGIYGAATLAYANTSQTLFASYQYKAELYFPLAENFEISAGQGGQMFPRFDDKSIYLFTGSLGKSFSNYYFWLRPYYFTPQSNLLMEIGARRTFENPDMYVAIRASKGHLPDIGDLPPFSNLITLSETAVGLSGQLPLPYNLYLKPDISYEHQIYPGGRVRNIATAFLGLFVRFN